MLANLKAAAFNRETVHVGGGEFSPAEVKAFVQAVEQLQVLIQRAESLGLTFDIGRAYISRAYIDEQTELRKQISNVLASLSES